MPIWEQLPAFYANSEQIDSSTDLNLMRVATGLIDRWSYRNEPAFDSSTGVDRINTPGYYDLTTPLRIWWGSALYVTGCTTLTIEGFGAKSSAELLKVYINGTDVSGSGTALGTITLPTGSSAAFSQAFTVTGLTDGTVVPIEIRAEGTHLSTATWVIMDVYFSAITKSGWVAAPSFAAVADATDPVKLNGLCFSLQWMFERMRLIPMVPRLALFYNLGPFKDPSSGDPQHTNRPMWYGSIGRYYANAELRIAGVIQSLTTTGYNFTVYLNGTLAYTSPTYGIGSTYPDVRIALSSYTLGSRVRVHILASATNGGTSNPLRFTRWTLGICHAYADSSGWPYATLPAKFVGPSASTNADALRIKLANLATIVNNAKARIDARPEQWARSRAMRRYYTRNTFTEQLLVARARPHVPQRSGSELFVKGKDIKVGYGPITVTVDAAANGFENYQYQRQESVSGAEAGALVAMDGLKGLDVGEAYAILGDPLYAAEYIS